jgi:hypothetical protein
MNSETNSKDCFKVYAGSVHTAIKRTVRIRCVCAVGWFAPSFWPIKSLVRCLQFVYIVKKSKRGYLSLEVNGDVCMRQRESVCVCGREREKEREREISAG